MRHTETNATQLVQRFYKPGCPLQKSKIDESLQELQRSQRGWQIADELLQSANNEVRFFGALTFTVKIERDWDFLSDEEASQLLNILITWLIRLINAGETKLIIKKLCSSLVSYFLRPSAPWENCIRHLVLSLHTGKFLRVGDVNHGPPTADIVSSLNYASTSAILWFAAYLVERVGQATRTTRTTQKYCERVSSNVDDVVALLRSSITGSFFSDSKSPKIHVVHGSQAISRQHPLAFPPY